MLIFRGLLGGLAQIAIFAALLFFPAGTWEWLRALLFLGVYGILSFISIIFLARFAPKSLEVRLQGPIAKTQPMADRIVSSLLFLSLFAWFISIPVEVFHWQIFPVPGFLITVFGAILFFIGYVIILMTIYQNEFAAPIVKDQTEQGQIVIDTGLYAIVRHPMYLGFIFFLIGLALWLESYLSVVLIAPVFLILIARIMVEEKTLRKSLPGYQGYMQKVRCRLVPFLW